MLRNNQTRLLRSVKSERVVALLAVSIRTAIRIRYGQTLSRGDSVDLARVHDLPGAMKAIAQKMEIHQNLPSTEGRFKLAINEAKLLSDSANDTKKILAIREASIKTVASSQASSVQRLLLVDALESIGREASDWGKAYSRFLTEIEILYRSTRNQLDGLHLPNSSREKAQAELESLIAAAIQRTTQVN
jgi:hypothetical protein